MKIHFFKYQATGNDFVLIDNRPGFLHFSKEQIGQLCSRRFGVGADGLILIENDPDANFSVNYYNNDGSQSLCGNGSRAAVHFASSLGLINGKARFSAYDGIHDAELLNSGVVRLKMHDVSKIDRIGEDFLIDTGSPHLVRIVDNVAQYPVVEQGKAIRYGEPFRKNGVNVNFVELSDGNSIFIRTYERGVEDETLSCGTGVTASALAVASLGYSSPVYVKSRGGELSVEFKTSQSATFQDIYLVGPAKMVYEGDLEL
jgi:diaminopimelate epimerase